MTAPLTPADCDLRDFSFMPLDIVRLFGSDFHAQSNDAEWRAGVTLWLRSYHQVPAGSLPDDEVALARLAELGRDVKTWRKVAKGALRGWVKCEDGRLYHRTVSEKALEGWIEKLLQRKSSEAGNAKRYGHPFDPAPIEAAIEASRRLLMALNPRSRVLAKRYVRTPTGSADQPPTGSPIGSPDDPPDDVPHHSQETGKGRDISSLRSDDASARDAPNKPVGRSASRSTKPPRRHEFPADAFDRWYAAYPHKVGRAAAEKAFARVAAADQVAFGTLMEGIDRYRRSKPADREWCNPTTWLNQARWADEPALSLIAPTVSPSTEPRVDFGGGILVPHSTIRSVWAKGRWPSDWGARPDQAGCRLSPDLMAAVMSEEAAA